MRSKRVLSVSIIVCAICLWVSFRDPAQQQSVQVPAQYAPLNGAAGDALGGEVATASTHRFAAQPPALELRPLDGSIAVIDEAEQEFCQESGFLDLTVHANAGKSPSRTRVDVVTGVWDPKATPSDDFLVTRIVLRGRDAILDGERGRVWKGREPVQLRARWLTASRLHIIDAESGDELSNVLLYRMDGISSPGVELPIEVGGAELVGSGLVSPITIDPLTVEGHSGANTIFAYQKAYAWGAISLDQTGGGDLYLRLKPGGDLFVQLTGPLPTPDMTVRLRRSEQSGNRKLLAERALTLSPDKGRSGLEIIGLAAGGYTASLERGNGDASQVLASTEVRISGGSDNRIEFEVPPIPQGAKVPVTILVRIDPSWQLDAFVLVVTDLDLPLRARERAKLIRSPIMTQVAGGAYTYEQLFLRGGKHELYLEEARYGVECIVAPPGPQEITLTVPPCGLVSITVLDSGTGMLVPQPSLCWSYLGGSGAPGGSGCVGIPPSGPGRFEFRAPAGKIRIDAGGGALGNYLGDSRTIEVAQGVQEIVVELKSARRVVLSLREAERAVDWSAHYMSDIKFSDSSGPVVVWRTVLDSGSGKLTCFVASPGKYMVSLPPLAGYMPIQDIEVDLSLAASAELTLQLIRQQ